MKAAALLCLAALVAACAAAVPRDLASAVQSSEIATAICLDKRSGDEAACGRGRHGPGRPFEVLDPVLSD